MRLKNADHITAMSFNTDMGVRYEIEKEDGGFIVKRIPYNELTPPATLTGALSMEIAVLLAEGDLDTLANGTAPRDIGTITKDLEESDTEPAVEIFHESTVESFPDDAAIEKFLVLDSFSERLNKKLNYRIRDEGTTVIFGSDVKAITQVLNQMREVFADVSKDINAITAAGMAKMTKYQEQIAEAEVALRIYNKAHEE